MKTFGALILIAALALISPAQRAQNNTDEKLKARNAPGVFIYGVSSVGPNKNGDSSFMIEVGNTGSKTITAIEWEYYSGRDAVGNDKRTIETSSKHKLTLLPEERRKLTHQVHRYTDKFVTGFTLDTVRIMRVQYEDGSEWRRPVDETQSLRE